MATPGAYISGVGHVGLMTWLIMGWGFSAEPLRIETMDVSLVSSEEYAALTQAARTPEPGEAEPDAPVQPEIDTAPPPPPPAEVEQRDPPPPPEPVEQPAEEVPPPPAPPAPPVAEVTDNAPVEPTPPAPPPATPDVVVSPRPTPRQADRVTSTITAPPPEDAQPDEVVRDAVVPDQAPEPEIVEEAQEATAPEATADQIVIEDEKPSGAIETSIRPQARPSRPTPQPEAPAVAEAAPEPAPEEATPEEPVEDTAVADALAAALATADNPPAPAAPVGPPLTGLEESSFRLSVSKCWVVDNGSQAANVTVEVGFTLDRNRRVVNSEVTLLSSSGGDDRATRAAFDSARRAILRCSVEGGGFPLPTEKYDHWKEVVLTFDPSQMRLR